MATKASGERRLHAEGVQRALLRVLLPIVRLAIRSGVTYPKLNDLLRQLYVSVAENEFALREKTQTDSRVSLLTGIHRKEVNRLRGMASEVAPVSDALSRSDVIVARWMAAPEFTDVNGLPRPLPRTSMGGMVGFDTLVESVTRDLRPRAVLDDWLDRGIVVFDEEQRVVLTEAAVVPRDDAGARLHFFALNLHDHIAAAVDNVVADQPPFFERSVHYNGLSGGLAEDLEKHGRDIAMQTLLALNRKANESAQEDPGGGWRWILGIYVYRSLDQQAPDPIVR